MTSDDTAVAKNPFGYSLYTLSGCLLNSEELHVPAGMLARVVHTLVPEGMAKKGASRDRGAPRLSASPVGGLDPAAQAVSPQGEPLTARREIPESTGGRDTLTRHDGARPCGMSRAP